MAVYSPPEQILYSPVTSYYQGKAIRQGLAAQEADTEFRKKQTEALSLDIENAPANREAARELALLQTENIRSIIDERVRNGDIAEMEVSARAVTPLLEDYANEEREGVALRRFNENFGSVISSLSEKEQARMIEAMGPDHVFNHEEIQRMGLGVRMFADDQKEDPKTHINYQMPDGSVRAARPDSQDANDIVANGGVVAGSQRLSDSGSGIKTADQSFMLRMVGQHFGALFERGPDGELIPKFMDPTRQRRASEITALAANLLQDGAASNAADAVKRAMKAYGQKWEEPGQKDGFDIKAAAKELGVTVKEIETAAEVHNLTPEQVVEEMRK